MSWKNCIIKIGTRIKLKKYEPYSDYIAHDGEVATIIKKLDDNPDFDYEIRWENIENGAFDTSHVKKDNIVVI